MGTNMTVGDTIKATLNVGGKPSEHYKVGRVILVMDSPTDGRGVLVKVTENTLLPEMPRAIKFFPFAGTEYTLEGVA